MALLLSWLESFRFLSITLHVCLFTRGELLLLLICLFTVWLPLPGDVVTTGDSGLFLFTPFVLFLTATLPESLLILFPRFLDCLFLLAFPIAARWHQNNLTLNFVVLF